MPHRFFCSALLGLALAGGLIAASPAHAATYTVTNTSDADDGACTAAGTDNGCSLREAINAANGDADSDSIVFDPSVTGEIDLWDTLPTLSTNIDITGPGAKSVALDGGHDVKIMTIGGAAAVNISGLTFQFGYDDTPLAREGGQGGGGAIEVFGPAGNLTVDGCLFLFNYSENEGGALNNYGTAVVRNSAFITNLAPFGGGINTYGAKGFIGDLTLENVTMTGNFSSQGGAVLNQGSLTVNTSTIAGNEASYGGGIADVTSTTCNNSIITDNYADYVGDDFQNGIFGGSFNFVGGDAMFDPAGLADNGGETPTIGLLPSSPCVNAGDPAYVGATYDQRGNPFDRVKQGQVDIGAFEAQGPRLTARDFGFSEGNTSHVVNYGISLSAPSADTITVNYATEDYTATVGVDYTAASGSVTFTPGQTTKTIPITILGNTLDEDNRAFLLTFSQATPLLAELGDATAYITINDDDLAPRVAIGAANVSEGDGGVTNLDFPVTLSTASGRTVYVDVVSDAGTITPAATPDDDYAPLSTTVTFAPGETLKYATVQVYGDTTVEQDEHLRVTLQSPGNAYFKAPTNTADGIITNDDTAVLPTLSVNDRSVSETEASRTVSFTVTLSQAAATPVTVHYATANGTATSGQDYNSASGLLTFAPGETTKMVTVTILGDAKDEDDETFFLNLDTPTNATIADGQGIGTIVDNDALPSLSIDNVSQSEGDSDTTAFTFTVTLTGSTGRNVTVVAQTAPSSAPSATGGVDYNSLAPLTLTFLPGETVKTVTVLVNGDTAVESNEKFALRLSSPVNATLKTSFGIGTITNDDVAPSFRALSAPLF